VKFAHIADTHIRNLKYHYEYRIVFDKLYQTLKDEKVDYIIHCGDIAHTKTQISPEFVEMCTNFFRSLADIAPTYIILGNHDGNLKNSSRQDALTPIVEALAHPNLNLLKNSGEVPLKGDFVLNVLSVFDEDNWVKPTDLSKINIGLYHGSISGVKTDTGWTMKHGDHPVEIFEGLDYGFLGDIHKTNQCLDEEGRIRYPGSTVQQNFGETNDKGFLTWEIDSKEDFTCRHIHIDNPRPFITIDLTSKGKIPQNILNTTPEKCRLRLVSHNNLPLNVMRKAIEVAKSKFKPESVTFLNRAAGEHGTVDKLASSLQAEDLRDITVQEDLIKEYLKDFDSSENLMDKVQQLNLKYNQLAEENEEVSRNVNWKLREIQWDNLFNYGESNSINFDNLNGIVGIFGKNFSGKSSIIDSILYTIFNSTSKNDRKNLNIINQNRESGRGQVKISIGEDDYFVERESEKYTRKLKGVVTEEARTNVNFNMYNASVDHIQPLNGLTRNDTDKNIRKAFGTLDDFLFSSMSSQLGALAFISEGSTRRKEILAKFLDLEFFDKKFKLAKEAVSDTKGALNKLEGRNYNEEIDDASSDLDATNDDLIDQQNACNRYDLAIKEKLQQREDIGTQIEAIPAEIIDVVTVRSELRDKRNQIISLSDANQELIITRDDNKKQYQKIIDFIDNFDIKSLHDDQNKIDELVAELVLLETDLNKEEGELDRNTNRVQLLDGIPCGTQFPTCKFIKDAYVSKATIPSNHQKIENFEESIEDLSDQVAAINPERVEEHLNKYTQVVGKKNTLSNDITNSDLQVEKNSSIIKDLMNEVGSLEEQVSEYELNKDAIENLESLLKTKKTLKREAANLQRLYDTCQEKVLMLYKTIGSCEQKIENIKEQKQQFIDLRDEYAAYDLYLRCMHPNGIAYDITKKRLPVINEEIAKILANIVDFEIFFEDDGKRLNIFIKHAEYNPRPLEMGSGAEKTIAAVAIRLALLSVSSLPKSDIFVLDEPGTALDEENMQGFIDILDLIKSYFKTVLLISHVDSLKDCVDMQITIDKREGYAFVQQ
tara:strand:+ start:704 stop:3862 length:3159 start_codon:yes stop_codon:yes gene_type:complete